MPVCYWTLCHCPDAQPCAEHEGIECGTFGGRSISDESQVQDAVTRDAENAILALADEDAKLDAVKARLDARKAELERDRDEFQRAVGEARSRAGRQRVIDLERAYESKYRNLNAELLATVAELDAIGQGPQAIVARLSNRVVIPYSSATGYCACYQRKRDRLAALGRQIAAEQTAVGAAQTRYNAYKAQLLPELKIVFSVATTFVIFGYLLFGFPTGHVILLLTVIAVAILVLAMVIDLVLLRAAIEASRTRLAKLFLAYYRVQQISTCRVPPPRDEEEEDGDEAFWERLFRQLEPEPR
jgi:hypothetical protein